MASNAQVTAELIAQTVPDDRQCVRNLTDILNGVQDFMLIQGLPQSEGNPFPTQDTPGEQALELVIQLQGQFAVLNSRFLDYRTSASATPLDTGDSGVPISWSPALSGTNYNVYVTFLLAGTTTPASYAWRVQTESMTPSGCTLRFDNIPANMAFTWKVETYINTTASQPTISGFTPITGSVADPVTIFGTNFTTAQVVQFNGVTAVFVVVSDTQITTNVPVGATTGPISVQTLSGTAVSADTFTV